RRDAAAPDTRQARAGLRGAAKAGRLPVSRRTRPGPVRRQGTRPARAPALVFPLGPSAACRRRRSRRAAPDRVARPRLRARGGPRGAAADPGAASARERPLRPSRSLRLSSPARRLGGVLRPAGADRADQEPAEGTARGAGAAGRRVGDDRRCAAEAAYEDAPARPRPAVRGRREAAGPDRGARRGRAGGLQARPPPADVRLHRRPGRRGRLATRVLRRQGTCRLRAALPRPERPRMAGRARGRRARGAGRIGRGGRRSACRRVVPPAPPARARGGPARRRGALYASSMEELRARATGGGWRKLVVDGVTATPVALKRGEAVKVVDGGHTETVDRAGWPGRLDELLAAARHVHLLAADGDLHARRTKKGRWLVSHGRAPPTPRAPEAHEPPREHP